MRMGLDYAAQWIEALLLGSMGTSIAILAIAGTGFAMLSGRLAPRDGLRVVLGCFILFGAPAIAQALHGLSQGGGSQSAGLAAPVPPPALSLPPPVPQNADPYAGASMPM